MQSDIKWQNIPEETYRNLSPLKISNMVAVAENKITEMPTLQYLNVNVEEKSTSSGVIMIKSIKF